MKLQWDKKRCKAIAERNLKQRILAMDSSKVGPLTPKLKCTKIATCKPTPFSTIATVPKITKPPIDVSAVPIAPVAHEMGTTNWTFLIEILKGVCKELILMVPLSGCPSLRYPHPWPTMSKNVMMFVT
jgi:hypothetical protein